ncbi:MAG: hypothetical protein HZA51_13780 [Planctomycetes bacterium]|nr:hypothetical protein [Planctomycetota bacterium]
MPRYPRLLPFILGFGLVLTLSSTAFATSGTPTWTLSTVSALDPNTAASSPDLAFDHYGTASLSWTATSTMAGTNFVRHSQFTPLGFWSHREIANGPGVGLRTAITFDRAERPTLAWVNDNGTVFGQFNYGANQSVAASGANVARPVVALTTDLTGSLRGMFNNAAVGSTSSIGYSNPNFNSAAMMSLSGVSVVLDSQMVVDDRGLRHVASRAALSAGGQGVVLASESPGGLWSSATFTTADFVDGIDIGVDPADGRLAIAYTTYTGTTSRLQYTKFNNGSLATTTIQTSNSNRFEDISLAFDASDSRPAIAYEMRTPSTQELWYTFLNQALSWQSASVDTSIVMDSPIGLPRAPSLAFDDFGTSWPAIAYVNQGVPNEVLTVAFDPPAPEPAAAGLLIVTLLADRPRRPRQTR